MTLLLLLAVPFYATLTDTLFMLQRGYRRWLPSFDPSLQLACPYCCLIEPRTLLHFAYQSFSLTSAGTARPNPNQLHGIAKDMKKRKVIGELGRRVGHPRRETMLRRQKGPNEDFNLLLQYWHGATSPPSFSTDLLTPPLHSAPRFLHQKR